MFLTTLSRRSHDYEYFAGRAQRVKKVGRGGGRRKRQRGQGKYEKVVRVVFH